MRKSIIAAALMLLSATGFCQLSRLHCIDKYEGTWKWCSGEDTLIVILQKQLINAAGGKVPVKVLTGRHKYVRSGQVIQSSIQGPGCSYDPGIAAGNARSSVISISCSHGNLRLKIFDLTFNKECELWLTFVKGSTTMLNWRLTDAEGDYSRPAGMQGILALPTAIILTRQ